LRVWIDWGEEKMKGGLRKLERGQSVGKLERLVVVSIVILILFIIIRKKINCITLVEYIFLLLKIYLIFIISFHIFWLGIL
jgi:hypothetical protein